MKRFIQHDELARDSRFVRQSNALSTVLASMPDDVETVVNAFEKFTPMIEASVRGTSAEKLFDAYGPAFARAVLNGPLDPNAKAGKVWVVMRMDGIFVGELQGVEGAARSLGDFPGASWGCKIGMARWCWVEAQRWQ